MTACDLEKSFTFDNKSFPKSFEKSHVATPHGRKWNRPLRVLPVQSNPPAFGAPLGSLYSNLAETFGVRKLEFLGSRVALFA